LLVIAARVGSPKMDRIGAIFLNIDHHHTGHISREDLAEKMSMASGCWEAELDADDFFDAADQGKKENISFLEFAATCLWGADDTTNTISERVFKALDDNHDGLVTLSECRHVFRDCDLMELRNLPLDKPVNMNEWRAAIGGSDEPPVRKKAPRNESMLSRFVRTLICSEDDPGAEDNYEVVCH